MLFLYHVKSSGVVEMEHGGEMGYQIFQRFMSEFWTESW